MSLHTVPQTQDGEGAREGQTEKRLAIQTADVM